MIIKGGSRSGPEQLAKHLQRRDTNETVDILELQSLAPNLNEALRDWQTLSEGTLGTKGLYHVNIDPAKEYVMTPEQWQRCVEVLEKELGFEGQPRAVVMHEKQGRQHIHVVWARTDIDTMTLRSDSMNYPAHERASKALELEFGHELVPGKHAKRDREKQPEFPNAAVNHAEWQQAERTGIKPTDRKDQITALQQVSDSGQAFKTALEAHGYMLAKGDRRDFVLIDQMGEAYSLARQIRGMKAVELREFMKGTDPQTLPTVEQAKEIRKEALSKQADAPASSELLADVKPPEPPADPAQAEREAATEALRKAVVARHEEETRRLVESHTVELNQLRQKLDLDTREKLDRFDALNKAQADAQLRRRQQEQTPAGITGLFSSIRDLFSPARVAEREADLRNEQAQLAERQKQERNEYAALLQQTMELEIENLTERHALQLGDHATRGKEDLDRYMREEETARRLLAEIEERERKREQELARDGPEWPPPHTL